MFAVADGGRADLIVKGLWGGENRGAYYDRMSRLFLTDRESEGSVNPATIQSMAGTGSELTYTLVPPGTGKRLGIDRDFDTFGDRTEIDAASDPANPGSRP